MTLIIALPFVLLNVEKVERKRKKYKKYLENEEVFR